MFKHIIERISATLLHHIYLKFSAVSAIDTSGISLFKELKATMEKRGVEARIFNTERICLICLHTLIDTS